MFFIIIFAINHREIQKITEKKTIKKSKGRSAGRNFEAALHDKLQARVRKTLYLLMIIFYQKRIIKKYIFRTLL